MSFKGSWRCCLWGVGGDMALARDDCGSCTGKSIDLAEQASL